MDPVFVKKNFLPFAVLVAILILFAGYYFFLSAPKNFPKGQTINVGQGVSLRYLSKELKLQDVIRSRIAFEAFVIIYGGEKHLVPGDYFFEKKSSVFDVSYRISKGQYHIAPVKVTIPEGFTVSEIADAFSPKLRNFNKDKFLEAAKDKEGYLFPDTYFFFTMANDQDVLKYMSDNFEKKIKPLLPEIKSFGKTEKEIIIMASIIEREAKGDDDRGIISGILWKRISIGMPLQVDAALETYKAKGLSKNPICNPGLDSIKAAIYPEKSKYLYYLHDKDGLIHYARTFEEHKANKLKYLK